LLNKPTEDSFRVVLTIIIAIIAAVTQLTNVIPEVYDTSSSYISVLQNKLDEKIIGLQEDLNGEWEVVNAVTIPAKLVSLLLYPIDVVIYTPLLIRDAVNSVWPPIGHYIGGLSNVLLVLAIINVFTRLVEVLLNRFRKT
jgi:hypothetical protein